MAFADRCFDGTYEDGPDDEISTLRAKLQTTENQAETLMEANAVLSRGNIAILTANAELTAHCEELRDVVHEALADSYVQADNNEPIYCRYCGKLVGACNETCRVNDWRAALAATPENSLAAIERRAAVKALREAAKIFGPDDNRNVQMYLVGERLIQEAERLEKEGGK